MWIVLVAVLFVSSADALPPGRTWTPYSTLQIPRTTDYLGMPLLRTDPAGRPYFSLSVNWDTASTRTWSVHSWADSGWRSSASSSAPAIGVPIAVVQSDLRHAVVRLGERDASFKIWLLMFEMGADSIGPPDSIFATTTQSTEYGAAASTRRRWAVRSDNRAETYVNHVRVAYSDSIGIWHEVEQLGEDEDHCTIAPLGDTTAIVVYAGQTELQYAILDGTRWGATGNLDSRPFNAAHPRLRLRRSGGLWLFWADNDWMHVSSYRDGSWERGDSVRCIPNQGETFRPTFLDAEMDTTEYPAVAWTNSGYGDTWRDVTAIAFGNGHGWDPGEEISNSAGSGAIAPSLTHDINGDLWLFWRIFRTGENRWAHTYCSATCAAPAVAPRGDGARLTWRLTTRAPASRWSVWRAEGEGGAFDSLGVVRAGEDSVLVFDDATARPGPLWRYRIRRESVDTRYVWNSDVASYQRADLAVPLGLALANPIADAQLTFQLTGAAGLLWARLYDLQGRQVLRERLAANGTGGDVFTLDLAGSGARRPGIYFLRITDATGRHTRAARVAVIR